MTERERDMEGIASLWNYQESIDEVKDRLLSTTFELESARTSAKEEMRKNEKIVKQLLQILLIVRQERDEARDHLHKLLIEFLPSPKITEANTYGSLPIDGQVSSGTTMIDHALAVIDNLVEGKPLPRKGRLLQTVIEAGPLLQTLLVAGPLPRWRNPPPLQPLQIPSFPIREGDPISLVNRNAVVNLNGTIRRSSSSSHLELPHGSSQTSSLSNSRHPLFDCINSGSMLNQIPIWKRRRFE